MIMTLSLLVYASLEHKNRKNLTKTKELFPITIKNKTTTIHTDGTLYDAVFS